MFVRSPNKDLTSAEWPRGLWAGTQPACCASGGRPPDLPLRVPGHALWDPDAPRVGTLLHPRLPALSLDLPTWTLVVLAAALLPRALGYFPFARGSLPLRLTLVPALPQRLPPLPDLLFCFSHPPPRAFPHREGHSEAPCTDPLTLDGTRNSFSLSS